MTAQIVGHWINGKVVAGGGAHQAIRNPATGAEVGKVALADASVIEAAVAAATAASAVWADTPLPRRVQVLYKFRELIIQNMDKIAELITEQHGKTLDDARGEINRGLEAVEVACSVPASIKGEMTAQTGPNIDTYSVLHPIGVCLGITPFNFPVMIPLGMLSIAIAAGNAFILKPSEQDPGPALLIARLAQQAGLPDGVLNVVNGGRDTVEALIDHPEVGAVSFVGSTPAAHAVYMRGAAAGKRVQALGGAKNHMVVMPDANLDSAADALSSAAFGSAGQRCMAITTAVAVGPIADQLVAKVAERTRAVKIGRGTDEGVEMGPLINGSSQNRVRGLIRSAREAGATVVIDRSEEDVAGCPAGYFVGPTLVDGVTTEMDIYQQEVFGPVLIVLRVNSLDEAVEIIKRNKYGNGAAIFTRDGNAARIFQRYVPAGQIGINVPIPVPVASYAFAGWKASAFGDNGIHNGAWRFYTRPKHVTARWSEPPVGVDLGFRPN